MQAVQPVDVQIAKKWRDGSAKRSSSTRLPVKVKTINGKKSQTVQTNQPNPSKNLCSTTALNRARSQSPPTRDPWLTTDFNVKIQRKEHFSFSFPGFRLLAARAKDKSSFGRFSFEIFLLLFSDD